LCRVPPDVLADAPGLTCLRWLLGELYGEDVTCFRPAAFYQEDLIGCPQGRRAKYNRYSAQLAPNQGIVEVNQDEDQSEGEGEAAD
jgi:hypothetical protein